MVARRRFREKAATTLSIRVKKKCRNNVDGDKRNVGKRIAIKWILQLLDAKIYFESDIYSSLRDSIGTIIDIITSIISNDIENKNRCYNMRDVKLSY